MPNRYGTLTIKQKITLILRILGSESGSYKSNFLRYHLIRRKYILSRVSEFFGKNKFEPAPLLNRKILDVGCGLNGISDELAFRGADIIAIDRNLEILTSAKNQGIHNGSPVEYQNRTLENLTTDEKFDVVLLLDFLHKNNIEKSLDKVQELLKENGVIIISGSNKSIKSYLRNIFIPRFLLKTSHLNITSRDMVTLKCIKNNLAKHGFSILGTQGIDFNFYIGKWYKSKSTRVRYILYASKVNPIIKQAQ